MKVVVDTNIIFSALLKSDSWFAETLFLSTPTYYLPRFSIVELFKHKDKLLSQSSLNEEELLETLHLLLKQVQFINEEIISTGRLIEAYHLCKDVDPKDMMFVALSLELDAVLWTQDKELMEGLRAKGFNSFFVERP